VACWCVAAGFGQYLVLLPVINGLQALRLRLRDNDTCMKSLNAFQVWGSIVHICHAPVADLAWPWVASTVIKDGTWTCLCS
jgi:hypothetical protein